MLNISVARAMVSLVERTGAEYRSVDAATIGEARSGKLWRWLRMTLPGALNARRVAFTPST